MSISKDLYRRLPYCIRKQLTRSQSFFLIVTIFLLAFVFVFYEAIFIGAQRDDPFDEKSIFQKDVSIIYFLSNVNSHMLFKNTHKNVTLKKPTIPAGFFCRFLFVPSLLRVCIFCLLKPCIRGLGHGTSYQVFCRTYA